MLTLWYTLSWNLPYTRRLNAGTALGHCLRRWPKVVPALSGRLVFAGCALISVARTAQAKYGVARTE